MYYKEHSDMPQTHYVQMLWFWHMGQETQVQVRSNAFLETDLKAHHSIIC